MKFAHLADIHLGGWRQPEMQALNLKAFQEAIGTCIKEKVDFIIFAGDLFDTALPSIDTLKDAMSEFKKINQAGIKCYIVSGSHDYSATGKTFLDVIERAGFCKNISCLEENQDKICVEVFEDNNILFVGLPGKKSSAEVDYFKKLLINGRDKLDPNKLKIFVFHSTLTEAKPEGMGFVDSVDIKDLPEGFDYYAGGHLHLVFDQPKQSGQNASVVYPGPVFPNNIDELEKLSSGSFYILEAEGNKIIKKERRDIKIKDTLTLEVNVDSFSSDKANLKILEEIEKQNLNDKIFLLKVKGILSSGKTSDIDWKRITEKVTEKKAYSFLKSATGLSTQELKLDVKTESQNIEEIENHFIKEYKTQISDDFKCFSDLITPLFNALETEKQESEKKDNFESRVFEEVKKILNLGD
ncbi:MAG: DNA repair exonuclease [Candidatus Pacearchaeota archaeon]|nr:DNA repair exonuclease [Candidatus Pacearchaeota archaeon]